MLVILCEQEAKEVRKSVISYGVATLDALFEMKGDRKFHSFSQNRRTSQSAVLGFFTYVTPD
ncbi:hypothetical protein QUB33_21200 [Microcoleus sp. B3-A4]|uniref:hypothetical protein n=1 Tax=Microcoleus sp. B3-A4 TaxID=2818653 RepID=UPI002FD22CF3